ncbi:MAG: 23S rRNA (pseudouridine(1915)-N(3))-methyltransferase RlmH [Dysgonamonadaceae bacterium]|jgi:23S rRNA (pseudouridine1915-N3)-methyltransferase|nr:23S rRNA (pseudouridine(1915)-N(3))-methyltransferase RlmH [Dysgonamonadaceae bacterium]
MKIIITAVGKTFQQFVSEGLDDYYSRIKHYLPLETHIINEAKSAKNLSIQQQKDYEGELILKSFQAGDYKVLLDEKGQSFSSTGFASFIEKRMQSGIKRLIFVIGGAYGFSQNVYNAADEKITLSQMTFSHQLVRLIFAEQLYRAMTIINKEQYHHS